MVSKWVVSLICIWVTYPVFAVYDILFENNTPYELRVETGVAEELEQEYYSNCLFHLMPPYKREKVQWFNFNTGIKNGSEYHFYVKVFRKNENGPPFMTFITTIKGEFYGSHITAVDLVTAEGKQTLFGGDPKPYYSRLVKKTLAQSPFGDKPHVQVRADAIKYTFPNPHYNMQSTDALSFVLTADQPTYHYTDNGSDLTLVSYNVQLWPFYGKTGGLIMNKPEQRAINISKKLSSYDVVTVQEAFSSGYQATLIGAMNNNYPYVVKPMVNQKPFNSGVVIFSRWPIVEEDKWEFSRCVGIDCAAAKGVLYAKINKQGHFYHIFSTHIQAEGDAHANYSNEASFEDEQDVIAARLEQFYELRQFIASKQIPQEEAVIVTGDLNINSMACQDINDSACDEFKRAINLLEANYQFHDNWQLLPFSVDGRLNWMKPTFSLKMLDYILPIKPFKQPLTYHSRMLVLRGEDDPLMYTGTPYGNTDLSDHFVLEASLAY